MLDTIKDLTFDNIYHEHVNYWSILSLNYFFNRIGMFITDVEHVDTHGGSIRVYIKKNQTNIKPSVTEFLFNEKEFGLDNYQTYLDFAEKIKHIKDNVIRNIQYLKNQGLTLVGYGSPAKATTSLNYFGITKEIDYLIEDNPLKHNKFLPGVNIPIFSKEKLNEKLPDIIIVMAWNFFEDIKKSNQDLIDKGVKFISIKELQTLNNLINE